MGIPRKQKRQGISYRKLSRPQVLCFTSLAARHGRRRGQLRVTPLAPTGGQEGRDRAGRGFLAAEESFRGIQGPPRTTKPRRETLARAASPVLLNTAETCKPQTPDNRSLTGGDGWAQQAADFTHTVLHICVGEGLRNQPSRFEVSALPGLQAKDPPQTSFAGWGRAHTYLSSIVRVN